MEVKSVEGTKYNTREKILQRAKEVIGIPLKDVDHTGRLATGKGAIGTVIEESWFGYTPNSKSEPDFPEAGVELKVTPYTHKRKGIRAKERLVCNIINYMDECNKTFKTSSFWHKCNTMLLMSYKYLDGRAKGDFKIDQAILFSFPEEDLIIIENDWNKIMQKIRAGKANEISEGDTLYLAACTKGASAASMRKQPFSDTLAKQRAYSLKSSYMTQILNKYIFGSEEDEHIIKDCKDLQGSDFEKFIIGKIAPYYGKSQEELKTLFGVTSNAKNLNDILLGKMLGIKGSIANTAEFKKAGIKPKTIRVQRNGKVKESMSFQAFDFIRLSKEESWENSEFYNYLAPNKFMFVIFQEDTNGQYVLNRIMFWNIPNKDLEQVGIVWEKTVQIIRQSVELKMQNKPFQNNFPKKADNPVAHVRPHGRKASDQLPLPGGQMVTKQCFWLNNTYIAEQIKVK